MTHTMTRTILRLRSETLCVLATDNTQAKPPRSRMNSCAVCQLTRPTY